MSGPKKWVSTKLGRSSSGSSAPDRLPQVGERTTSLGPASSALASLEDSTSSGTPSNASTTPPKKAWEWHYKSFLSRQGKGGGKDGSVEPPKLVASTSVGSIPPDKDKGFTSRFKNRRRSPSKGELSSSLTNSPVSLSNSPVRPQQRAFEPSSAPVLSGHTALSSSPDGPFPPPPFLPADMGPEPLSAASSSLGQKKTKKERTDLPLDMHACASDSAVRGGSLFKSVFNKTGGSKDRGNSIGRAHSIGNSSTASKGIPSNSALVYNRSKAKSCDSLDSTRRRGHEKTYPAAANFDSRNRTYSSEANGRSTQTNAESILNHHPKQSHHHVTFRSTSKDDSVQSNRSSGSSDLDDMSMRRGKPRRERMKEMTKEMKLAFTEFHNSAKYGKDSTSPYLGDDTSVHQRNEYFAIASSRAKAGTSFMPPTRVSSSVPLAPVTEGVVFKSKPILNTLMSSESWVEGKRHLIAPAILSMCPFQVLSKLCETRETELPPSPAMLPDGSDEKIHDSLHRSVASSAYRKIILGKAVVSQLGARALSDENYGWSSGIFVLRQNYLLEYGEEDNLNGLPRGFAHLQYSEVQPHNDFTNVLLIKFYSSPCARGDKRMLLFRVENRRERDQWVSFLAVSARLAINDLYEFDGSGEGLEFGRGRYATIRPAKRRNHSVHPTNSDGGVRRSGSSSGLDNEESIQGGIVSLRKNPTSVACRSSSSISRDDYDCALKVIDKNDFWDRVRKGRERADTLVREAAVQATLTVQGGTVPTFLHLRGFFETSDNFVLELELLNGMDLFRHVSVKGVLSESEAALIMCDLLRSLVAMQRIGIAHRDVKPANILMCDEENDGVSIKLGDFGMAAFVGVDNLVRGRCGTPGYVAPEILSAGVNSGYGNKVDVFSAGVTLYVMLCGYEPFYGESDAELIEANREAKVEYPESEWGTVSVEGRDLVEKMLKADPKERISASEALKHAWIARRVTQSRREQESKPETDVEAVACAIC